MVKEKSVKTDPIKEDYYVDLVEKSYADENMDKQAREQVYVVSHKKLSDDVNKQEKLGIISMCLMCLKTVIAGVCFIKNPEGTAGTALCACGFVDILSAMIFSHLSEKSEKKVKRIEEIKTASDSKNNIPQTTAQNDELGIEI